MSLARVSIVLAALLGGCSPAAPPRPRAEPVVPARASPAGAETAAPVPTAPELAIAGDPPFEPQRFGKASRVRPRVRIDPVKPEAPPATSLARPSYGRWALLSTIRVGYGYLSVLDVSVDERWLLVVSEEEARVRLYELATLRLVAAHTLPGQREFGRADFAFFPGDPERPAFVYASDAGLSLHDAASGERVALLDGRGAWQLRFSDDRRWVSAVLSNIESQTSRLALYAVTGPDQITLVDELEFSERVDGWDLSRDAKRLVVSHYPSNRVELLNLEEATLLWSTPGPASVRDLDIAPDDARLAAGGDRAVLMDLSTGEAQASFDAFDNNVHEVRFSPGGDALAVSAYDGRLRLLSSEITGPKLRLLKLLRHAGTANVYALRFFAGGTRLASASGDQTVRLWGDPAAASR